MATCEWAILCDYAFQDVGRKTCLIGIFDRIFTARVPATHHQASVVVKLIGEHHEHVRIRLAISRPTGESLAEVTGDGELGDTGTIELGINLRTISLPDFGIYGINVFVNDVLSKTVTFAVIRPPQPPQPQLPQPPPQPPQQG